MGSQVKAICRATADDTLDVLRMTERAYEAGGHSVYMGEYDHARMDVLVAHLINDDDADIFIAKDGDEALGMVALAMSHVVISADYSMAQEITWWVEPDHRENGIGERLLEAALEWAHSRDVHLWMSAPKASQSIAQMCVKRGFRLLESIYIKGA